MTKSAPTRVLLLVDSPETAQRWSELVARVDPTFLVWVGVDALPDGEQVDLVITNRATWPEIDDRIGPVDPGWAGVITVGVDRFRGRDADAVLPADFTDREFSLACRLLAQVAHLRRQVDETGHARDAMADLAMRDPLTSLPNRRAWEETLRAVSAETAATARQVCISIVDLDHFKQVNDRLGHAEGDRILRCAADALAGRLRRDDFVARIGGDEFGLLLCDVDRQAAGAVVERVRRDLLGPSDGTEPVVSASAGYALGRSGCADSLAAMLQGADAALRRAKQEGRDRTVGATG